MEEKAAELKGLVAFLVKHQKTRDLSDRAMIAQFKNPNGRLLLGSAKTWRERLCGADYSSLNVGRWVNRLSEVRLQIEGGARSTNFFKDLPITKLLTGELDRLEGASNDRRCVVCLAPTGVGKSVFIQAAARERPSCRRAVAAHPGWRDSVTNICCGILADFGEEQPPYYGAAAAIDKLTRILQSMTWTLLIDEAHDGGVALMRVCRHLIDRTATRIFYSGYPTEFARVRTATAGAITEAQQFLGRCQKPIFDDYQEGTKDADVEFYVRQALGFDEADARTVATATTTTLQRRYNLRLLEDAIELAEKKSDEKDEEVTPAGLIKVVEQLAALPQKGAR